MARDVRTAPGMQKIPAAVGSQALLALLQCQGPIMLVQVNWAVYLQEFKEKTCLEEVSDVERVEKQQIARSRELSHLVLNLLAELVGVSPEDVKHDSGFDELGLDSLNQNRFASMLTQQTGISVSYFDLVDHYNLGRLCQFLIKNSSQIGLELLPPEAAIPEAALPEAAIAEAVLPEAHGLPDHQGIYDDAHHIHDAMANATGSYAGAAISGVAFRYPGAGADITSLHKFWNVLQDSQDCVSTIPSDRWDSTLFPAIYTDSIAHLQRLDLFDATMFHIAPDSALNMDPQLRLSLETTHQALQDSGIPARGECTQAASISVFAGYMTSDFAFLAGLGTSPQVPKGTIFGLFPNHLSHSFNFTGASVSVQSACSSSLVAVDMALNELRLGRSHQAIALGANAILSPELMVQACNMKMLSQSGRCRSFDHQADGYVRGEGCGVIVVSRHGSGSHGTLLAAFTAHDGRSSSLTVPNPLSQQHVVEGALSTCRIEAEAVGLLEAHGTGTPRGDPLEVKALKGVFASRAQPLLLGTAKTTWGHLEAASGIIGLHRAICCLRHGCIPRHIWLRKLSSEVADQLGTGWCEIVSEPVALRESVAGISNFGLGGTNVHALLEKEQLLETTDRMLLKDATMGSSPSLLLVLSGHSETSLSQLKAQWMCKLRSCANADVWDLCLAAAAGGSHFSNRFAATGPLDSLLEALGRKDKASSPQSHISSVRIELDYGDMEYSDVQWNPLFRKLVDCGGRAVGLIWLLRIWGVTVQLDGLPEQHLALLRAQAEKVDIGGKPDCALLAQAQVPAIRIRALYLGPERLPVSGFSLLSALLEMVAKLYTSGYKLNWANFAASFRPSPIPFSVFSSLPNYPFDQQSFELRQQPHSLRSQATPIALARSARRLPWRLEASWPLCLEDGHFLLEHRVEGRAILPAAQHLEWLLEATEIDGALENVQLVSPLFLVAGRSLDFNIQGQWLDPERLELKVFVGEAESKERRLLCKAVTDQGSQPPPQPPQDEAGPTLSTADIYKELATLGLNYEGSFQAIQTAVRRSQSMWATVRPGPVVTILDAGFQTLALAMPSELRGDFVVPVRIRRVQVWGSLAGTQRVCAVWEAQMAVPWVLFLGDGDRPLGMLVGVEVKAVERNEKPLLPKPEMQSEMLFFKEVWAPEGAEMLGLAEVEQEKLVKAAESEIEASDDFRLEEERSKDLNTLARAYMTRILLRDGHCRHLQQAQVERFRAVLRDHCQQDDLAKEFCQGNASAWKIDARIQLLEGTLQSCPESLLLKKCGQWLTQNASQPDPHSLLFPEAKAVYSAGVSATLAHRIIASKADAMWRVAPERTRVLEVGAGTGATARAVLESKLLPPTNYCFTDVSKHFLHEARRELGVSTAVLNIEQDPEKQGFLAHSFHVVFCTNVLHATQDPQVALHHVWRCCAPDAVLVLCETMENDCWLDLTFGLTDGWWRRGSSPLLPLESWKRLLTAGFEPFFWSQGRQAVICARALKPLESLSKRSRSLMVEEKPWTSAGLQVALRRSLALADSDAEAVAPEQAVGGLKGEVDKLMGVIFLCALESKTSANSLPLDDMPSYHQRTSGALVKILQVLPAKAKLLVITKGAVATGQERAINSHQATLWGLVRGL
ncbi:unnamed protein product, partial [Effrenium voratum]